MMRLGKKLYEKVLFDASNYRNFENEERNMKHFCAESLELALAYLLMSNKQEAKSEVQQALDCFQGYLWQRRCS